jgi:hypothetical protein
MEGSRTSLIFITTILLLNITLGVINAAQRSSQNDGDPTGTWKWSISQSWEVTLKLKLDGDNLTGAIVERNGQEIPIRNAKYQDGDLSFAVVRGRNGKITLNYSGKLHGDIIRGKVATEINGELTSRDWEAKRVGVDTFGSRNSFDVHSSRGFGEQAPTVGEYLKSISNAEENRPGFPKSAPLEKPAIAANDNPFALRNRRGEYGETRYPVEQDPVEQARLCGEQAGYNDGHRTGDAEGYASGFKAGEESWFRKTLSDIHASGNYYLEPFYCLIIAIVTFLTGFLIQYVVMYILRAMGLGDIDGIMLSTADTELSQGQ